MKIIINRTDAIGDLLLTLPIVKLLKEHYPESHITIMVSPRVRGLISTNDYIDEIWELDFTRSKISLLFDVFNKFLKNRPDIYLHVGGSFIPTVAAWLVKVSKRGGLKSKPLSHLLLNYGVRQKRSIVEMHESEYNINLLAPLGIHCHFQDIYKYAPEIAINESELQESLKFLKHDFAAADMSPLKPYIVVHPGMTGHTLNWSALNYARVIANLNIKLKSEYNFIVSYTPSDRQYLNQFKEELDLLPKSVQHSILFFDGSKRGLKDYINVLSGASLFLGPSTGTMHIANFLKKKVVTIFSPIKVQSALRWGPFFRDDRLTKVIIPQTVCGEQFKCAEEKCPYYDCMSTIEVEDVANSCVSLLRTV